MIFAAVTPETSVTISLIAVVLTASITVYGAFSDRKQKREITYGDEFVRKPECLLLHSQMEVRLQSVEQGMENAADSASRRSTLLHQKIESGRLEMKTDIESVKEHIGEVSNSVAALQSANLLGAQRTAEINSKLDRLIERKT